MAGPTNYQTAWLKVQTAWGTPSTPDANDAIDCEVIAFPVTEEALNPEVAQSGAHSIPPTAGSLAGTPIVFRGVLHGWSSTTPSDNPTATPEDLLFERMFGGVIRDGYSTDVQATASATTFDVTAGVADHVGHAVLVPSAESPSARTVRWIKSLSTNTYTTFGTGAYEVGTGTGYGSAVFYLDPTATPLPMTLRVKGATAEADYLYSDVFVSGDCRMTLDAQGQWSFEIPAIALNRDESAAAGPAAAAALTYPRVPAATAVNGSHMLVNEVAACWGSVTLTVNVPTPPLENLRCHNAAQGVGQVYTLRRSAMLEMQGLDTAMDSLRSAGATIGPIQIDGNTTPGRACSVLVPNAFADAKEEPVDIGGLLGTRLMVRPGFYNSDGGSTAANDVPLKFAKL